MQWYPSMDPTLPKVWERVWSNAEDVTCQPIETWPSYPQRYIREGWRPKLYPGEEVEWPDPATLTVPRIAGARDGRRGSGRA